MFLTSFILDLTELIVEKMRSHFFSVFFPPGPSGFLTADMSDAGVLQAHLARFSVGHYTDVLLRAGYDMSNLHILSAADLQKLRITNKADRKQLLAVASMQSSERMRSKSPRVPHSKDTCVLRPTAVDCCRSAANYIAHHRVDRAWPKCASSLAVNAGLSFAKHPEGGDEVFSVRLPTELLLDERCHGTVVRASRSDKPHQRERWNVTCQPHVSRVDAAWSPRNVNDTVVVNVSARPGHEHGQQAARCECCEQHVKEKSACFSGGQWQYQVREAVHVSEDVTDHVFMWKPFAAVESMIIENAWRKKLDNVKIGGVILDLLEMQWRGHKVRRNSDYSVAFPSLGRREITQAPGLPTEHVDALEKEFADAFLRLVDTAENQDRCRVQLDEESELLRLRAEIALDVAETFAAERERLADAEQVARRLIEESEYEAATDKLWEYLAQGMQDAVLATNTRAMQEEANAVCIYQQRILLDLEDIDRNSIIDAESAEWANLCKLVARFNAQVRALLAGAADKISPNSTLRCPLCCRADCPFFRTKWASHWAHHERVSPETRRGSASPRSTPRASTATRGISAIMAQVQETEYGELLQQYPKLSVKVKPPSPRLYPRPARGDAAGLTGEPTAADMKGKAPPFLCGLATYRIPKRPESAPSRAQSSRCRMEVVTCNENQ